jgi:hypothetical protein
MSLPNYNRLHGFTHEKPKNEGYKDKYICRSV